MGWVIENLSGTKNGTNVNFTISNVPVADTLLIFQQGLPLERVTSQPGQLGYAYVQSSTNITVGLAPLSTTALWCRYFY